MPIKAVLFDLGDTLIRNNLTPSEILQKILERKGIYVRVENVEKAYREANDEYGREFEELAGKMPLSEFYILWNTHVLDALRLEDDGHVAREIHEEWLETCEIEVFPDVYPALSTLRDRNVKMGIISNAYEEEIRIICGMVGLKEDFFDTIVGSDTVGKGKPDPEIFVHAAKNLEVRLDEAMYVGNSVEKDYRGAEGAGMKPLLLVRGDAHVPGRVMYVRTLASLKEYLE